MCAQHRSEALRTAVNSTNEETEVELAEAVRNYVDDTFNYITLIEKYENNFSEWCNLQEKEKIEIQDILEGVRNLNRTLADAMQAKSMKTFMKYKLTPNLKCYTEKELRKKLQRVLDNIFNSMPGVREVPEAIEKLSVTCPAVFCKANKLLKYPEGMNEKKVHMFIRMAKEVAPYMVNFRRDVRELFKDDLENVENLAYQHSLYVQLHRELHCRILSRSAHQTDYHFVRSFHYIYLLVFVCICVYAVFKTMHCEKHFVNPGIKDLQTGSESKHFVNPGIKDLQTGSESKCSHIWGFLVISVLVWVLSHFFLKQ
ncbi:uncharacterized protein LOC120536814 isoform X2 [Polypterus senegalus]|uniref:uncharacterized protein LOC120536814 isoform X2 n=1 Tax=Polypterus senegalus TaxID=55291 RepID=UPI0019644105|nr:uncharacterized protein LOC120536814 isoform X2 [Polypterus senegalus]